MASQGNKTTAAKDHSSGGAAIVTASESNKPGSNTLTNLPLKLHALLEEAEKQGLNDVISWQNNGTAFKVHDKTRFTKELMPRYFTTTNYQVRKMNVRTNLEFSVSHCLTRWFDSTSSLLTVLSKKL